MRVVLLAVFALTLHCYYPHSFRYTTTTYHIAFLFFFRLELIGGIEMSQESCTWGVDSERGKGDKY